MPRSTETSSRQHQAKIVSPYTGTHIHLIGVGGAGMRALAEMLLDHGAIVSGSDMTGGSAVEQLQEMGATVHIGQRGANLPILCDLVVHSAAIHEQNPELLAARERGIEVVKYSQMLGRLMSQRMGIAVSGTHGKSTTTAMVAYVLRASGADPCFVVGATVEQLGGPSGVGAGRHFVAEACEFDRSFLNLHPYCAAILNLEEDHLDCYADLRAIIEAFKSFAAQIAPEGLLVVNGEDRSALAAAQAARCEVQTFGLAEGCLWRGVRLACHHGKYTFDVEVGGKPFCHVRLALAGLHNVYNSLAACALLHQAGVAPEAISDHIAGFQGAVRRMTFKGRKAGVNIVDDYAHHPTEIQVTLRALREQYRPRKLICVFQPHQHSRTRFLLKDFARSFAHADEVVVPDIYFVRDSAREKDYISSEDLVAQIRLHGGNARYLKTFEEILGYLEKELKSGDLLVTMGAGNIWEVADGIVPRLTGNR